jgi:drug/metabolite transporter (DMT)-like permease
MREFLFFLVVLFAGTGGELCVTRAMKTVGEAHDFRPRALAQFLFRALRVGWLWAGIALMAMAFFALLAMLSIDRVSFVVPVTALSYGVGALGSASLLGEKVSRERWIGVLVVCAGVTLVLLGKH